MNRRPRVTPEPVNNTDDWWDDADAFWVENPPENKIEYRIMRAQKVTTTGSPGFVIQWKLWKVYDKKTDRDSAIEKLAKDNPKWKLKIDEGNPYLERVGSPIPKEGINK